MKMNSNLSPLCWTLTALVLCLGAATVTVAYEGQAVGGHRFQHGYDQVQYYSMTSVILALTVYTVVLELIAGIKTLLFASFLVIS